MFIIFRSVTHYIQYIHTSRIPLFSLAFLCRSWLLSSPSSHSKGSDLPQGSDLPLRVLGWVQDLMRGLWDTVSSSSSSSSLTGGPVMTRGDLEAMERKGRLISRLLLLFSDVKGVAKAVAAKVGRRGHIAAPCLRLPKGHTNVSSDPFCRCPSPCPWSATGPTSRLDSRSACSSPLVRSSTLQRPRTTDR